MIVQRPRTSAPYVSMSFWASTSLPRLVAPFQVDVGGPGEVGPMAEHRRVGGTGVEPHVQDVLLLLELPALAARAGEARGEQVLGLALVPGVGALLLEEVGQAAAEVGLHHGLATALAV